MIEDNLVRCGSKELNDGKKKEKVEPSANNPLRERVPKQMSAIKGPNRAAPNISKRSEHDSQEKVGEMDRGPGISALELAAAEARTRKGEANVPFRQLGHRQRNIEAKNCAISVLHLVLALSLIRFEIACPQLGRVRDSVSGVFLRPVSHGKTF